MSTPEKDNPESPDAFENGELPPGFEEGMEGYENAGFTSATHGPAWIAPHPRGTRLHVRYFRKPGEAFIVGRAWFGPGTEGPPGHAHGGSIASLLDEAMGLATFYLGKAALARSINVSFEKPVPLEKTVHFEASVTKTDGRKVYTEGKLFREDGDVACVSTGLFLQLDPQHMEPFMEALGKLQKEVTDPSDS